MIKMVARFFKALSDETRLRILQLLSVREMCVCELIDVLKMSQPAVSHHLRILRQAGLVNDRRHGKWTLYSLDETSFSCYQEALAKLFAWPIGDLGPGVRPGPGACQELEGWPQSDPARIAGADSTRG